MIESHLAPGEIAAVMTRGILSASVHFDFERPSSPFVASDAPDGSPAGQRAKTYRILVADDHEAIRRGLRTTLLAAGWQICGEAANGREAIDMASELNPDLVILDISMPVMGGLEAAREILKKDQGVKIVAFTMHESQQMKDEMEKIGVHAVAVKSAPIGDLLDAVRSLLGT
ncbi:MAG: response regulator [Candidatus Acidiferrales bacterium]